MNTKRRIRVLSVEDDPFTAMVYADLLAEIEQIQFELQSVETLNAGLDALKKQKYDVLLLDLNLPDSGFANTIDTISSIADDIAIVVMTGTNDENLALKAVNNGGQDYLVKDKLDRQTLRRSILYALERHQLRIDLRDAKNRSDTLLKSILPEAIATELKTRGKVQARQFEDVSVMFVDFSNFTAISQQMSTEQLVDELHLCFSEFDNIAATYGLEKIKTIGDSYMCAAGVPIESAHHQKRIVMGALHMLDFINQRYEEKRSQGNPYWHARIGMHTGPLIAGVVGINKFTYDVWGNTVNIASRMESHGEVGKVNISHDLYQHVADCADLIFTPRGARDVKGAGMMEMYFVERDHR